MPRRWRSPRKNWKKWRGNLEDHPPPTAESPDLAEKTAAYVLVLALAAICVVADYFLKLASQKPNLLKDINLYIGAAIYALAAVGWAVSFQYLKLSTVGTLYSVSTLMLLAALGYHFGETIGPLELVGILLGISAIVLLYKFA